MKFLLDVNVILDVALNRAPFVQDSALLLNAVDQGRAEGFVAAHTITTAFYVTAISLGWRDFEDAVQAVSAEKIAADAIVTRDPKDFKATAIAVRSPAQVLALL